MRVSNLYNLTVFIFILIVGCVRQPAINQPKIIGEDGNGLVTLEVRGLGRNLKEIEQDAARSAFEAILLQGIPSSSQNENRYPLIPNKELMTTSPILKNFFANDEYKNYITNFYRLETIKSRTSERQKALPYVITINKVALRRYLERNQLIRGFGY